MTQSRQQMLEHLPSRELRLELADISTAILESGQGAPIVLLHGPGASALHWLGVIPGLSEHNRVIAPDLPGHGASVVRQRPLDQARVLRWLDELIDQTCSSAPLLVGQLLGGAIAARFAIAHPERLARLVLIDSFGLVGFQPAPEFGKALTEFNARPDEESHQRLWRQCSSDFPGLQRRLGKLWRPFEDYNIERARSPEQQAALHELMGAFAAVPIPSEELAGIRVPTALIWGRHDLATPLKVAAAASARYSWPLHVIEDANDDPPVERPDDVLEALRRSA
jgi:pimeloyl-ACP methyl ester carboxylesterase